MNILLVYYSSCTDTPNSQELLEDITNAYLQALVELKSPVTSSAWREIDTSGWVECNGAGREREGTEE